MTEKQLEFTRSENRVECCSTQFEGNAGGIHAEKHLRGILNLNVDGRRTSWATGENLAKRNDKKSNSKKPSRSW